MKLKDLPEPPDGSTVVVEFNNGVRMAFWRKDGADPRGPQVGQWFEADLFCKWSDPLDWETVSDSENVVAMYSVQSDPIATR